MSDDPDALAHFGPGDATAVVGPSLTALLVTGPDAELVDQLWSVVDRSGTFDAALTTLGASGFEGLPPLAVLGWVGATARVVVRGEVQVELFAADVLVATVAGGDVHSWAEHAVVGVDRAVLRVAVDGDVLGAGGAAYRLNRGVVPAAVIEVMASEASASGGLVEVPAAIRVVADDERPADPGRGEPPPVQNDLDTPVESGDEDAHAEVADDPAEIGESPVTSDELPPPPPPSTAELPLPVADETPPPPVAVPLPPPPVVELAKDDPSAPADEVASEPDAPPPRSAETIAADELWSVDGSEGSPVPATATDDGYDHLFGATEYRSVEDAAVRPEDAPVAPDAPAAPVTGSTDHDGRTITMSELDAARQSGPIPAPVADGAEGFLAVRCADGHLNPPHADSCRACGAEIFTQSPVRLERPDLGVLQFSHGAEVQLVGPLLIGRSPKLSGALNGAVPELVTVPSPEQDISRTHLEVRVEGWRVMVVDRDSTNGTVVVLPGRAPQRLRPDEPFPLPPGARVSLAEEIEFTFEVPR